MPHDHTHPNGHHHDHRHDHGPGHGHGHNHAHGDHMHSHMHEADEAGDLQVLTAQFIDGFVQAADKASYLKLAGVPFERPGLNDDRGGTKALKLVDVELTTDWQVGTASPSFGSRELSYLPFPGEMVRERTNMALVYVSMDEKAKLDIRSFLADRKTEIDR